MNRLITENTGKMPFYLNDIRFLDAAYRSGFEALVKAFFPDCILSGCNVTTVPDISITIAEGYVAIAGEIFYHPTETIAWIDDYQNNAAFVITETATEIRIFGDGTPHPVYLNRIVRVQNLGGEQGVFIGSPKLLEMIYNQIKLTSPNGVCVTDAQNIIRTEPRKQCFNKDFATVAEMLAGNTEKPINGNVLKKHGEYIAITSLGLFNTGWSQGFPGTLSSYIPSFRIINNNFLHIVGNFKCETPNSELVFTLPIGYRPVYASYFPVIKISGTPTVFGAVNTNGTVYIIGSNNSNMVLAINALIPLD
jgi:hypothetical protein